MTRRQFALTTLWGTGLAVLSGTNGIGRAWGADTPQAPGRTFLLAPPAEADLKLPPRNVHYTVFFKWASDTGRRLFTLVDRSKVDPQLALETRGLRLYVSSPECLKAYQKLESDSEDQVTLAYLIRTVLGRRIGETGLEPDRIPVRGVEGKKLGTQGLVFIEGGEYVRPGRWYQWSDGLTEQRGDRYRVRLRSFSMDKYKVSIADYCRFLNDGNPGYWSPPGKVYFYPQLPEAIARASDGRFTVVPERAAVPVTGISWYQAVGYAEWAGKRLPTEAEWEYAAGGKHGYQYPWGNEPPDPKRAHILIGLRSVPGDTYPRGATPEGVFDLAGNGAQWVRDYFDHDYYAKAPAGGVLINPTGPPQGVASAQFARMLKGWCRCPENSEILLQNNKRHPRGPLHTDSMVGFRCAKSDIAEKPSK